MTTSKQITDYVLCRDCEDLFNRNGENWMLKQVWNGRRFPLGDRLRLALPLYPLKEALVFSGAAIGVDTDRLGYFALSVIWRAGVHQWEQSRPALELGSIQEPIRQFLIGGAPLPSEIAVLTTVCTDPYSRVFYMPSQTTGMPVTSFGMLTLGVHFMVFVEPFPPALHEMCSVRSAQRLIFQRDCSEKTLEAFAQLMSQHPIHILGQS
jgi:hypothetical protein